MTFKILTSAFALGVILYCLSLSPATLAQDDSATTTALPSQVEFCNESASIAVNLTQFAGVWWEVARYPALTNFLCVEVDFTVHANDQVNIATTYSKSPTYPWVNQTMTTNIVVDPLSENESGYNISFVNGLTNTSYVVFKLLATDYSSYALICGYSNGSDNSTDFGIVLTRLRVPSTSALDGYIALGSEKYADFVNNSMSLITQGITCLGNSANSLQFSYGTVLIVLVLKLLHYFGSYSK